jgi:ATP-dependent Clp protease ATP-binding subunit ClpC
VTAREVADDLDAIVGRGPEPYAGELVYTPRMRRLLKLTGDELRELGHTTVGTGHLLLGLLREGEGLAVGILEDLGVDTEKLREAVLAELANGDG